MCWYVCKFFIGIILVIKNMYLYVIKVIGYCIVEKFIEVIIFWKFLVKFVIKVIKSIYKNIIIKIKKWFMKWVEKKFVDL